MQNMPFDVRAIANEFIWMSQEFLPNSLKLHIFCFMANGFHLAFTGRKLIFDDAIARRYGVQYLRLSRALARHGVEEISDLIRLYDESPASFVSGRIEDRGPIIKMELMPISRCIINNLYEHIKDMSKIDLISLLMNKTPWHYVLYSEGEGSLIPDDVIRKYYKNIITIHS